MGLIVYTLLSLIFLPFQVKVVNRRGEKDNKESVWNVGAVCCSAIFLTFLTIQSLLNPLIYQHLISFIGFSKIKTSQFCRLINHNSRYNYLSGYKKPSEPSLRHQNIIKYHTSQKLLTFHTWEIAGKESYLWRSPRRIFPPSLTRHLTSLGA